MLAEKKVDRIKEEGCMKIDFNSVLVRGEG
jgi:hypothetical protein